MQTFGCFLVLACGFVVGALFWWAWKVVPRVDDWEEWK